MDLKKDYDEESLLSEETFKEIFNGDFSQFVDKYKREEKDVGGDDDLIMGDLPEVKEA